MITNQQFANLIQSKLNGDYSPELGEFENIHKYGLNAFSPNVRYEFKIFASDGEYAKAENRDAQLGTTTNTVTQYINGVLKTPGGSPVEGVSAETLNTAVEAHIELLIPNCDDVGTFAHDGDSVSIRFQDLVYLLVQDVLSIPSDDTMYDNDGISYFIGTRFSNASMSERQHRTQVGLSVILSMFMTFSVVAMGISSRQIKLSLKVDGVYEDIYFNRISISRTSTQENNVKATPNGESNQYGISRARTTATQMIIAFSAPVRPSILNALMTSYIVFGIVDKLTVRLSIPSHIITVQGKKQLLYEKNEYTMTFAEAGIAGEENLNAAYDIRLVEEMEG